MGKKVMVLDKVTWFVLKKVNKVEFSLPKRVTRTNGFLQINNSCPYISNEDLQQLLKNIKQFIPFKMNSNIVGKKSFKEKMFHFFQ